MTVYCCGFDGFRQVSPATKKQQRGFVTVPVVVNLQSKIGTTCPGYDPDCCYVVRFLLRQLGFLVISADCSLYCSPGMLVEWR